MRIFFFFFLVIKLLGYDFSSFTQTDIDNAKNEAGSVNNSFKTYQDPNNLQTKFLDPMTTGKELSTIDNSSSAKANLTCEENNYPFAIVSYTGESDITINIKLDLNNDGAFDKDFSFNGISGVGTNGVAICTPNTFNNCKFYLWDINANSDINLIETTSNNIYGLYCINCNNISLNSKKQVLSDIVAGISKILQDYSSNYIITQSSYDSINNSFSLFGQNFNNCENFNTSSTYNASNNHIPSSAELEEQGEMLQNEDNDIYTTYSSYVKNEDSIYEENNVDKDTLVNDVKTNSKDSATNIEYDKDSNSISYTDKDGVDVSSSIIKIEQEEKVYCLVKILSYNTQTNPDGTDIARDEDNTSTYKEEIRECIDNVCPYDSSKESIKYDCGHTDNSLGEVGATFSSIENIVNDFSCSK